MFQSPTASFSGSAGARYHAIDVAARIEGADPHRLVAILFDELVKTLDILIAGQRRNDRARRADRLSKLLSILSALETSLDFEAGGELAVNLYQIYRTARRQILAGVRENRIDLLETTRAMLGEIATAWNEIR